MCTVSWCHRSGGAPEAVVAFELLFNRDEARTRARGAPPAVMTTPNGTRYLAPRDPDAGGTWIVANEHGVAVCLLNRYVKETAWAPSAPGASRGQIVRDLADAPTAEAVATRLADADLGIFRGFTVLTVDATGGAVTAAWDGRALAVCTDPISPLASSGHAPEEVESVRRSTWRSTEMAAGGGSVSNRLLTFHRSHAPRRGALSPCMHRALASTVSLSHIEVTRHQVRMAYADGPPCRTPLAPPLTLTRTGL